MAKLELNTPFSTDQKTITFEIDPAKPLAIGAHVIRLVVVDDSNNQSDPQEVTFNVVDTQKPTAIIDVNPDKPEFGANFELSGARSADVGGSIKTYIWTLVR